jgi:hypothetical protein
LPSASLWVLDKDWIEHPTLHRGYPVYIDSKSLPSFRLFLSKRPHAVPLALFSREPESLPRLVEVLNEQAPKKIQELDIKCHAIPSVTLNVNALQQLSGLQRLRFSGVFMHFTANTLTALSSLTSMKIECRLVTFEENCFPSSLKELSLLDEHRCNWWESPVGICVVGFENLNIQGLTSLIMKGVQYRAPTNEESAWYIYKHIWNSISLQHLEIETEGLQRELPWPQEVSNLTMLTYLSLGFLTKYKAEDANITSLQNLRTFKLECFESDIPDGLPKGTFELPMLKTLKVFSSGDFILTSPSIWKIENLELGIYSFVDYDFSMPLAQDPHLKKLTLGYRHSSLEQLPPFKGDALNLTLKNLLRFLAHMRNLKYLGFVSSTLSGRVTQGSVGRIVEFVQQRPDIHLEFNISGSDYSD